MGQAEANELIVAVVAVQSLINLTDLMLGAQAVGVTGKLNKAMIKLQEVDTKMEQLKTINKRNDVSDQFIEDNLKIILTLRAERRALINTIVTLKMQKLGHEE